MPEPIELRVVADARRGDAAALTALYEHFKQDVFRFIYYRTNDVEVAADLTGDVFEKMIKALPAYKPQRPFAAWLFKIARNRVIDYWRQQQVRQQVPLDEGLPSTDVSPEEMVEQKLTVERLVRALPHLTVDQRDVLILRYVVGMRIRSVATTMEKSEGAVRMLQQRALKALRNRLLPREEMP
jgi:RNA polymerase sigma-70 factor (ECF subfamily)